MNLFGKGMKMIVVVFAVFLVACSVGSKDDASSTDASFPKKDINGVIQWGEGGATDIISRTLASIAEDDIGASLITVPRQVLLPIIAVITVIGSYALNNSMTDVYWMLGFGIIGFFMKIYKFPVAPLVLGIILGPLVDTSFRRAFMASDGGLDFLYGFINAPITLILTVVFAFTLLSQTNMFAKVKARFKRV